MRLSCGLLASSGVATTAIRDGLTKSIYGSFHIEFSLAIPIETVFPFALNKITRNGDGCNPTYQNIYKLTSEAAEKLSVSIVTVRKWLREGRLKGVKVSGMWRVNESDLEPMIQEVNVNNEETQLSEE